MSIEDPKLNEIVTEEYARQLLHNEQARDILLLSMSAFEYARMRNSNLDGITS